MLPRRSRAGRPGARRCRSARGEDRAHLGELHEPLRPGTRRWRRRRAARSASCPGTGMRRGDGRAGHALDAAHPQQRARHRRAGVAGAHHGRTPGRRGPPRRPARARSPSCAGRPGAGSSSISMTSDATTWGEAARRRRLRRAADQQDRDAELVGGLRGRRRRSRRAPCRRPPRRPRRAARRVSAPGPDDQSTSMAWRPLYQPHVPHTTCGQLGGASSAGRCCEPGRRASRPRPGGCGSSPSTSSSWGRPSVDPSCDGAGAG